MKERIERLQDAIDAVNCSAGFSVDDENIDIVLEAAKTYLELLKTDPIDLRIVLAELKQASLELDECEELLHKGDELDASRWRKLKEIFSADHHNPHVTVNESGTIWISGIFTGNTLEEAVDAIS